MLWPCLRAESFACLSVCRLCHFLRLRWLCTVLPCAVLLLCFIGALLGLSSIKRSSFIHTGCRQSQTILNNLLSVSSWLVRPCVVGLSCSGFRGFGVP